MCRLLVLQYIAVYTYTHIIITDTMSVPFLKERLSSEGHVYFPEHVVAQLLNKPSLTRHMKTNDNATSCSKINNPDKTFTNGHNVIITNKDFYLGVISNK